MLVMEGRIIIARAIMPAAPIIMQSSSMPSLSSFNRSSVPKNNWGRKSKASEIGQGFNSKSSLSFRSSSSPLKERVNKRNKKSTSPSSSVNSITQVNQLADSNNDKMKEVDGNLLSKDSESVNKKKTRIRQKIYMLPSNKKPTLSTILSNKPTSNKDEIKPVRMLGNELSSKAEKKWKLMQEKKNIEENEKQEKILETKMERKEIGKQKYDQWMKETDKKKRQENIDKIENRNEFLSASATITKIRSFIARDMLTLQSTIQDIKLLPTSKQKKTYCDDILKLKQQFDAEMIKIKLKLSSEEFSKSEEYNDEYIDKIYSNTANIISEIREIGDVVKEKAKSKKIKEQKYREEIVPNFVKNIESSAFNNKNKSAFKESKFGHVSLIKTNQNKIINPKKKGITKEESFESKSVSVSSHHSASSVNYEDANYDDESEKGSTPKSQILNDDEIGEEMNNNGEEEEVELVIGDTGQWWMGFKGTDGYEFENLPIPDEDIFGERSLDDNEESISDILSETNNQLLDDIPEDEETTE